MNKWNISIMMSLVVNTLSVVVIFSHCVLSVQPDYEEFLEQMNVEELYWTLGPKELLEKFSNQTKLHNLPNSVCSRDLMLYTSGLERQESWAVQMLDSSSKIPSGLLLGNIIDMGMYDECMLVHVHKNDNEIVGNHCTYTLYFSYNNKTLVVNPMLSICIPLSCEEKDLNELLRQRIQDIGGYQKYNITNHEVLCSTAHSEKWVGSYIVISSQFALLLVLLIFTIITLLREKQIFKSDVSQAVSELSLHKNIRSIFSLKDNPSSISALHGLRAINTTMIIIAHGFIVRVMSLHANNVEISQLPVYLSILVGLVMYGVDTFLTISGFLVSYSFLKKHTLTKEKLDLGTYYLHRYIRLTPAIAAALLASIYIVPFLGSGPKWRKMSKDMTADVCKEKWWTILLYVNNLVYKDNNCMPHLWSTAVDMQLFWISPLILYPLAKKPKLGLFILSLLIVASFAIPAVVIAINNYPFALELDASFALILKMFTNLYIPTYTRASPWLVGVLLGFIVLRGPEKLSKTTVLIGWLITTVSCLFCITGYCISTSSYYEYNVIWESTFGAISRPIWSIATSWIIFTAIRGYGGLVNKFLSLPVFFPISRLSFCLYLIHLGIQVLNSQTVRNPTYFRWYHLMLGFLEDFTLSLLFAILFCIVFEMPARTLERLILNPTSNNHKSQDNLDETCEKKEVKDIEA